MTIHINLISHQLLPNVITTLGDDVANIEKVILVLGDEKLSEHAQLLKDFYQRKGICQVELFQCKTSTDYAQLRHHADSLYQQLREQYPAVTLALNASGGTKPMSIAFTQAFDKFDELSMAIYTDTSSKKISILNEKGGSLPYRSVLDVEDYLYLNKMPPNEYISLESRDHDDVKARSAVTKKMLDLCRQTPSVLKIINAIASQSHFGNQVKPYNAEVMLHSQPHGVLQDALGVFAEHGLITYTEQAVVFTSSEAARYIGGGWLEEYAYLAALDAGIEHVAMNVKGHWLDANNQESSVSNELDVILVHNNQMMLIECKTSDWSQSGKGQATTLKLESLMRNLGGSHANGMLVSVFDIGAHTQERISGFENLTPLIGRDLSDLVAWLKDWKNSIS